MNTTINLSIFKCFFLFSLAIQLVPAVGQSQELQPSRQEMEREAPAVRLCELLYYKNVRDSLHLSDEALDKLHKALSPIHEATPMYEGFSAGSFNDRMRAARPMLEKGRQIDDTIWAMLTELLPPSELDSLMGAHIRWTGTDALFNRRICNALSLLDDQIAAMQSAVNAERQRRRKVLTEVAAGTVDNTSRKSLILREEVLLAEAMKTLNEKQRKRLNELLSAGAPITPSVKRFGFGW